MGYEDGIEARKPRPERLYAKFRSRVDQECRAVVVADERACPHPVVFRVFRGAHPARASDDRYAVARARSEYFKFHVRKQYPHAGGGQWPPFSLALFLAEGYFKNMGENKKTPELMAVLDYVLNRCTLREIDALEAAVERRRRDLSAQSALFRSIPRARPVR
jgi:hypothetical protein